MDPLYGLILIVVATIVCAAISSWRNHRRHVADSTTFPKIARMKVHPIRCSACSNALADGQLVVWREAANGHRTPMMHASCGVILRHPDGSLTKIDGSTIATDLVHIVPLTASMVIDVAEWTSWSESAADSN